MKKLVSMTSICLILLLSVFSFEGNKKFLIGNYFNCDPQIILQKYKNTNLVIKIAKNDSFCISNNLNEADKKEIINEHLYIFNTNSLFEIVDYEPKNFSYFELFYKGQKNEQ